MNYALYILPVLLAVSIPSALAEVGQNYDTVTNDDGSITWTSHPERILVNNEWQNYFLEVNESKVIFNSNSVGSFIFDKDTCSYSIYENGWANPETQIIPSVSAVATYLKDGTWENMEVNESDCFVSVEENKNGIELTSMKYLDMGINEFLNANGTTTLIPMNQRFVQEINLDINRGIKETFYIYDNSNSGNELGISQTIHVGESIVMGTEEIQISDFDGMSFDRDFIVENESEILQVAQNLNYDMDEGINYLSSVNIIHDSSFFDNTYKVNLDYSNGSFIGYLEIDPTFTTNNPDLDGILKDNSNNNVCDTPSNRETSGITVEISSGRTGSILDCKVGFFEFPISGIPSNAVVTNVDFEFSMYGVSNPRNCDYVDLGTVKPSTATDSDLFDEILLDNDYTDFDQLIK